MSKTKKAQPRGLGKGERRISIRAIRRHPPDLTKLSRAVITLALAEVAAEQSHIISAAKSQTPAERTHEAPND